MITSQNCILIVIAVYLIGMLLIGLACSKKNKNVDDFYLGGRQLSPLVTAMSAEASDMSSWLLMGLPGVAYLTGLADATWTAIGLAIGTYINWLIVAKRLRVYSHDINAITIPDFFSKRFGDKKNMLSCIAAIVIVVFFVPYTASGFAACGKLFNTILGVDYVTAMVVSAIVIILYCALGGFLAASTTDFIQSIVMTIALVVILGFGEGIVHGFDNVIANAKELPGYLSLTNIHVPETGGSAPYSTLTIASMLAWGLGYFGMPHVLLRFMAIEDENKLKVSRRIATVWVVISMTVAVMIGVVGYSMTKAGVIEELTGANSETIIVVISSLISSYGYIPACVAGLILSGILAATMSTADSQLIAASSSITQDLMQNFFNVKLSQKASMMIARLTIVGVSVIGIFLARNPNSSVFEIVSFAWAGFGASFGPVMLAALFWKRCNKWGALAGMISGGAMIFIWKYGIAKLGGVFAIYELLPAFVVATVVLVVVSLATGEPEKEVADQFDASMAKCKLGK